MSSNKDTLYLVNIVHRFDLKPCTDIDLPSELDRMKIAVVKARFLNAGGTMLIIMSMFIKATFRV